VRWQAIVRFGLGYTLPLLATAIYFGTRGALGSLWDATFAYNVNQAGTSALRIPYGLLAGSWHIFSGSAALLWLLASGGILLVLARQRQYRLLVCWALADALSLCLGGSKFAQVYYVQLVPSLALLGGLAFAFGWVALKGMPLVRAYALLVLASVLALSNEFQMSVLLRAWNERTPPRASTPPEQLLGQRFGGELGGRPLFIWGDNSEMYLFAGARAPGRFFQTFALSHVYADRGYLQRRAELLLSFENALPGVIAIDPATSRDDADGALGLNVSSFPELQALLEKSYEPIDVGSGWRAYRLKT
jgi:hypothetical protein